MKMMSSLAFCVLITFLSIVISKKPECDLLVGPVEDYLTSVEEQPYVVNIRRNGRNHCSGSLVAPNCVLTAASCIADDNHSYVKEFSVHGGTSCDFNKGASRRIEDYFLPPSYNESRDMDVVILKLAEPLRGKHIKTIPLDFHKVYENETVSVSGWGWFNPGAFHYPEKLEQMRTVNMTVISWLDCGAIYYTMHHVVTDKMGCAVNADKGSYVSGKGSVVVREGHQVGVVVGGGSGGKPEVFTSFDNFAVVDYIQTTMDHYCYTE